MDKKSIRIINKVDNIRIIQRNVLKWDTEYNQWFEYTQYIVQVCTSFCFGLLYKWCDIQVWIVDDYFDDTWCYNEAMELFNIITNKYGKF